MTTPLQDTRDTPHRAPEPLALAMRAGRMGWWARNLVTNAVQWSPELEAIFGLEPGTFAGHEAGFFAFVHPEDRDRVRVAVERAIAERGDYVVEFRFRHASGEWRWMDGRGRVSEGEDGSLQWLYGLGLDITERREAERILELQSQEILRLYEAARRFSSTLDLPTLYRAFRELAAEAVPCDGVIVSAVDHERGRIRCAYAWVGGVEQDPTLLSELELNLEGSGMQTEVIRTGEPRLFPDVAERVKRPGRYYEVDDTGKQRRIHPDDPKSPRTRAALMVPLKLSGKVMGVVQVMTDRAPGFAVEHLVTVEALTGPLAVAVQNALLYADAERELIERRRHERRLAAEHAVTRVLSTSTVLEDAARPLLESVGRSLGFPIGALWLVDPHQDRIRCAYVWDDDNSGFARFVSHTRELTFERGAGLPGRVWGSQKSAWVRDVALEPDFPRGPTAVAAGLHSGFAFPISVDGRVIGTVEFFAPQIAEPDQALLDMTGAIGAEIGLWIEKRRVEQHLRESEERMRVALATAPITLVHYDRELRYSWVANPAPPFTAESLIGKSETDFLAPHEAEPLAEFKRRVLETERGETREMPMTLGGRKQIFLISLEPRRDASGAVTGLTEVAYDITDRKRLEERLRRSVDQLEEADRQKDEFLATLAHELRNPLAPIRNAVRILRSQGDVDSATRWCQDVIDRQVAHMARLLDDLLDVSRITRRQLELRRERVELSVLVESAVETSKPLIDAGRHALTVRLPAEPVWLHADTVRVAQVFANLLNNAAKYTDPGGRIELVAERRGREVVVAIHDTGIGIASDMLPRLFQIFSQAPSAVGRAQGGLGIGLSLVRGLVDLHGGTIEARSEGEHRGSTFIVRLPALTSEAPPESSSEESVPVPAVEGEIRVLVADDFHDHAESLARLIELSGYSVRTAFDGEDAIRSLQEFRPATVVLDLGMPNQDGYQVARWIRRQPWGAGAVLVALTGWGQEADRRRTREAGFDHHLVKPVDAEEILQILREGAAHGRPPAEP
jgi:PAS domain S-box-containing protein